MRYGLPEGAWPQFDGDRTGFTMEERQEIADAMCAAWQRWVKAVRE